MRIVDKKIFTKYLFMIVFTFSCGNNIKLKNNRLENQAPLTVNQLKSKSAVLSKGHTNQLSFEDRTYVISQYSSKNTFDFLDTMSSGSSVDVIFTGKFSGNEVVIETISRK